MTATAPTRMPGEAAPDVPLNEIPADALDATALTAAFRDVRATTERLIAALGPEDQNLQAMPEASPVKWHRAHTTWFFETFLLDREIDDWAWVDPAYCELFNSYYNGIGRQHPRARRHLIARPDHAAVTAYRERIDAAMIDLLEGLDPAGIQRVAERVVLGLNHEQQHQELILTDYKAALPDNPLGRTLGEFPGDCAASTPDLRWQAFDGGEFEIGHAGTGFCFDNETPRHRVLLNHSFELAHRPVTCAEWTQFIDEGGYREPLLWLSDGWAWLQQSGRRMPEYWLDDGRIQTLAGRRERRDEEPVVHINFYEAMAFAEWAGARLPTEAEWEIAACRSATPPSERGHFADAGRFHPEPSAGDGPLLQLFGGVWEWTQSAYLPYPGFSAAAGAIGEYNGKFMANQMVLRGGSCATPAGHVRASYRNFFYPADRWQFSGLRLARSI